MNSMVSSGLRYGWKVSLAVGLGVATATTVIVGALLVGDSMRGSLRQLTTERLGKTVALVAPGTFFRAEGIVADDVGSAALILFPSAVAEFSKDGQATRRAGNVQIIGCDQAFWEFDDSGVVPKSLPGNESVVLNQSAAQELNVSVGDQITLRLPTQDAVPADSTLGKREIRSESLPRMTVVDILDNRGLGRFSIAANQAAPQNIYVQRETVADAIEKQRKANVLLLDREVELEQLDIQLVDMGMTLKRMTQRFPDADSSDSETIFDYFSLTSERLLLQDEAVERTLAALPKDSVAPINAYLANAIERLDSEGNVAATVPYSIVASMDSHPDLPLDYDGGVQVGDRIPLVINDWIAERLDAQPGTPLRVAYFEPEVEDGREIERFFDVVVADVVPITEPSRPYRRRRQAVFDKPPTIYNDPNLTPEVPGVTDQDSINDWDLPFELKRETNADDDTYWNNYRLTPKAFMPLEDGQRLFGSRFGHTTSLRIDIGQGPIEKLQGEITEAVQPELAAVGWSVQPIRRQQLSAAQGTTPFDGLFLALSFFVIFAAVMLIAMLFRLGLIQRMKQFGTLLAIGWKPKQVGKLVFGEGMIVAAVGVVAGVAGGVVYAKLILWGLRTLWVGAVTVPFLKFDWTLTSLCIGALCGWLVAMITMWWTMRSLLKVDAQSLLSGRDEDQLVSGARSVQQSKLGYVAVVMAIVAVSIAAAGALAGGQSAAGGFVGGGMLLLIAILVWIYDCLRAPRQINDENLVVNYNVNTLAIRNGSRHPLRSTLTIGLMATAAFLIVAMAALRLEPTERGTGGFDLVAESASPLYKDLRDDSFRGETLGPDAQLLDGGSIVSMQMRPGQDASCNNLYQATAPTVLGVPDDFADLFEAKSQQLPGFVWAGHGSLEKNESPWRLLERGATGSEQDPIPVVLDQNTAMWSLKLMGVGAKRAFEFEPGQPMFFQVVGLLSNSVLQGRLMIGEKNFRQHFPEISGQRFFLVSCDEAQKANVAAALESRLSDIGMDASDSATVLAGMLAVQNTYLSTFQSLGALGLLLGTIGLAVAQLRSVLERRRELAVMRAIGFTRPRLARVVLSETATLLLLGIGCGTLCAVMAVLPYAWISGMEVPVLQPLMVVVGIIAFGMLAGVVAVSQVLRIPMIDALRSE